MNEISVKLNKFSSGSHDLGEKDLFPTHQKTLESSLSKIFEKSVGRIPKEGEIFQIQFKPGRAILQMEGKEIHLEKTDELKKIQRIIRYYQHTGQLPREKGDSKDLAKRELDAKKSVYAVNQASIPGSNGSILAGMRLADDTLSLARNILFAIPRIGPKDPVANHLGYYSGFFWTFFSLRELDDGVIEYKRSKTIGDGEGQRRAESRIVSGVLVSAGSTSFLAGKFCETLSSSHAVASAMGAANGFFGIGSLWAMGVSLLGAVRCSRFHKRLNEYLDHPKLSEVKRMEGALRFLKDSITVTAEEKSALAFEIDQKNPSLSSEEKGVLLRQKISDLAEIKVKYMKRRTSNKSLALILASADSLLERLGDKNLSGQAIQEAAVLIDTVRHESRVKLSLYFLGFLAALIGFIGMMIMAFSGASTVPFILYGITGTIYLSISLYTIGGMFIKKDPQGATTDFLEKEGMGLAPVGVPVR